MLCLCRVLLAAVVVSCTLSRSQANGPSTQRSDRIKDLMCVLLLSGMQKDDLDANVLNKLQRHNVNIHDLNNEKLVQDCTTYQYLHNENITPQINTFVTENSLNKLTSKIKDVLITNNLTNNNINNNNNFTKYEHKNKNNEDEVKYVDGPPELKSVLNFWKDIKIDNSSIITESPIKINMDDDVINKNYRPEQKNKRNVPNGSNSNESDTIQKILMNFLLKNQNKYINKPVKMTFDNGDYNKVYLLGTRTDKKNTEINENTKTADMAPGERAQLEVKAMPIKQYALINNPSQNDWQLKVPEGDSEREKPNPNNSKNFNDILNALQSYFPIKSNDRSIESLYDNNKEIESIYFKKNSERELSFTTEKSIHPKLIEQNISQNIIKEIANSVKDLVLSDLRKEIFKTTASYPTTEKPYSTRYFTTEREYIATTKIENQHIEQSILNKFMDLFEEIKTLNHKTLIISSENKRDNIITKEAIHNTYSGVVLPMINNGMVNTQSNYKTKQYLNPKSQKILNFSPQIHKFRSNAVSERIKQVPQKRAQPITFQTNNMEIPPLGIPVNKPENPINQNIIVSTMKPYRIGVYGDDYEKIKSADPRNTNGYIPKKTEIRILKSQEPTIYDLSHENDKRHTIINDHINYNTNFDDRVTLNRYKQQVHRGNGVKRGNIQRFHEKLERDRDYFNDPIQKEYTRIVDCCDERYAYSKQMVDCCNRKIASRQQMSLNHVKRHPSYDTHFNNFIKSQKKVTDMLERILASRVRGRSVETA